MDNKNNDQVKKENSASYYDLKKDAVNDLVDALKNDSGEQITNGKNKNDQSQEFNPYSVDKLSKIPTWIKALFVKFWFAGAICYFCLWGLGNYISSQLDLIILTGIITGLVTDIIINNAFLYFQSNKREFEKYMFITVSGKKIWPIFANIILAIIEVLGVTLIYKIINQNIQNPSDMLGVEPILYGLFFVLIDMTLISIKNLIQKLIKQKIKKF